MKYPASCSDFLPEPTGQVIFVDPDNPEHRAIFGNAICDAMKERQAKPFKVNRFVQIHPKPKPKKP